MKRYLVPLTVLAACGSCAVQAANQTIAWKPIPYFKGPDPLHTFVKPPDNPVRTIWECDASSNQSNCNAKPEKTTMPVAKRMGAVLPPPEYDKPYTGNLVVIEMDSQNKIRLACPNTKFPEYALACTIRYPDRCIIYIINQEEMDKTRFTTRVVMRHERGHCNGWSAEHLNSRVPTAAEY